MLCSYGGAQLRGVVWGIYLYRRFLGGSGQLRQSEAGDQKLFDKALELCLAICAPYVSVLALFMVECSYVIQIFLEKVEDDAGTLVMCVASFC